MSLHCVILSIRGKVDDEDGIRFAIAAEACVVEYLSIKLKKKATYPIAPGWTTSITYS